MYCKAISALIAAVLFMSLTAVSGNAATTGPSVIDKVPPPCSDEMKAPDQGESVQIMGKTLCSEYGAHHKEPLLAIFRSGDFERTVEINKDDGLFHVRLPAGREYTFSMGMDGKAFKVGSFTLPAGGPSKKVLEVYHPGSMLELIWEARAGDDEGGTDFKLKDEQ